MLILELLTEIYPEELRKEAAHHHLVSLVQKNSINKKLSFSRLLAWLGGRLCSWGYLLQNRFGETGPVTSSKTIKGGSKA